MGETFETESYTITKEEVIGFAEQFGPQPFHLDEEAARNSMFGELVASGMHTLCLPFRGTPRVAGTGSPVRVDSTE